MSEPSGNLHKKHSYWVQVLIHSKEEIVVGEIIAESIAGLMLVFIAIKSGVASRDEIGELIFLCIGGAVLVPFIGFLIRCLFVTPPKLKREIEEKLEIAESKLKERDQVKLLEIEALPARKTSDTDWQYVGEILVHNENQSINGVKLRLIKVEPEFLAAYIQAGVVSHCTSDRCDLDYIKFSLDGTTASVLGGKSNVRIPIFTVERTSAGTTLKFSGQMPSETQYVFAPKIENSLVCEHFLTLETSATGIDAHPEKFKLSFSTDRNKPPFAFEKINPPQAVNSLEIQDKPKKHKDPAIVVILLCLSSSLIVLAAAQRFQIFNLTNPQPPKSVAAATPKVIIIPKPEAAKSERPPQPTNVEPQKQLEVFSPQSDTSTNVVDNALKKAKSDVYKQKEQRLSNISSNWKISYPIYNRELTELHDILFDKARELQDNIIQPSDYSTCLPFSINQDIQFSNYTYIKLQKNTNWDFEVSVNTDGEWKLLRISCSGAWVEIRGDPSGFHRWFQFTDSELSGIHLEKTVPIEKANDLVDETIKTLKEQQKDFLGKTSIK